MSNSTTSNSTTSNSIPTPTLQTLIKRKIHLKNLSLSDLLSAIGYTNISKGTRRLNIFLNTLEAPSEEFINNLLTILEIDALSFYKSLTASLQKFNNQAKTDFKPYIQIILDIEIRPRFAALMVKNKCSTPVPSKLQKQALEDARSLGVSPHHSYPRQSWTPLPVPWQQVRPGI